MSYTKKLYHPPPPPLASMINSDAYIAEYVLRVFKISAEIQ